MSRRCVRQRTDSRGPSRHCGDASRRLSAGRVATPRVNLMINLLNRYLSLLLIAAGLSGCGGAARLSVAEGSGSEPVLPAPEHALIPVVNVAPATGWPAGGKPVAAPETVVARFAEGLDHPRWIYVLPNGDVLVAETNAPPKPEDGKGIKGWIMKKEMAN